ncbi:MAG: L-idonate 5-dehydrogenase [Alphaproteobacteria bacterium]|nr:L-idonate 5-dehydrogenase [Alphaproteobacteria bacterium]
MRFAAVIHAARDLRFECVAEPSLAEGWVRLRFGCGGICGSDLHYFLHGRTGSFAVVEPLVLGHEFAGRVIEIAGTADGLAVGDRVAVNPSRSCGTCARCCEGRGNLCPDVFFMGSASKRPHMQGCFAQTIDVRAGQCVKIPAHLPFAEAALAEPLSVCLHAANRAGPLDGRKVLVVGAGPIGLFLTAVAKWRGAGHVAATDLEQSALDRAGAMGADAVYHAHAGAPPGTGSYDVVFEASGSPRGVASAIDAARRGGILVQVGSLPGDPFPVPFNAVVAKELDIRGSFRFADVYAQAVGLIADGTIDVKPAITATVPLSRAGEAFELASDRRRSAKIVLTAD